MCFRASKVFAMSEIDVISGTFGRVVGSSYIFLTDTSITCATKVVVSFIDEVEE